MNPAIATLLVAIGAALVTALGLAAGALWRLGSKVGSFETAVTVAKAAAVAAEQASQDAQAASQRAAADAIAAARALYDAMTVTVSSFQDKLEEVRRELSEAEGHYKESHDLVEKVNDHEKRLYALERDHERNHGLSPLPLEQSARHYLPVPPGPEEDDAPLVDGLFDDDKSKRGGG